MTTKIIKHQKSMGLAFLLLMILILQGPELRATIQTNWAFILLKNNQLPTASHLFDNTDSNSLARNRGIARIKHAQGFTDQALRHLEQTASTENPHSNYLVMVYSQSLGLDHILFEATPEPDKLEMLTLILWQEWLARGYPINRFKDRFDLPADDLSFVNSYLTGLEFLEAGNAEAAHLAFTAAREQNSNSFYEALLAFEIGRIVKPSEQDLWFEKTLSSATPWPGFLAATYFLYEQKDMDKAVTWSERLIAAYPTSYLGYAAAANSQTDSNQAIDYLKQALTFTQTEQESIQTNLLILRLMTKSQNKAVVLAFAQELEIEYSRSEHTRMNALRTYLELGACQLAAESLQRTPIPENPTLATEYGLLEAQWHEQCHD